MMSSSAKAGQAALLLEGFDDKRFYANFTHAKCLTFPLNGRSEVLGALTVLAKRNVKGCAGIIDADCDHLNGSVCDPNVFRTDGRDIECYLITSPALDKVLKEHLIEVPAADVRQLLFATCRDIGLLR